jgi:hypothetical protein
VASSVRRGAGDVARGRHALGEGVVGGHPAFVRARAVVEADRIVRRAGVDATDEREAIRAGRASVVGLAARLNEAVVARGVPRSEPASGVADLATAPDDDRRALPDAITEQRGLRLVARQYASAHEDDGGSHLVSMKARPAPSANFTNVYARRDAKA